MPNSYDPNPNENRKAKKMIWQCWDSNSVLNLPLYNVIKRESMLQLAKEKAGM